VRWAGPWPERYLEYQSMSFWIAIAILNTIALIAILVASRELDKALRAIDTLSSLSSASLTDIHLSTASESMAWKWFSSWRSRRTSASPRDSQNGISLSPYRTTDIESPNV
jgi:hypothetical protein